MRVRCGWAEIVDPVDRKAIGRGLLFVRHTPLPYLMPGRWDGDIVFLRGYESLSERDRDLWLLRLYEGTEHYWVRLTSLEKAWAPSGLRATACVASDDGEFPSLLSELGGDG